MDAKSSKKEILFPDSYVFGKGVFLPAFNFVLFGSILDDEGKVVKEPKEVRKELEKKLGADFPDELARRTIRFKVNLEGFTLTEILERHATSTTLAKQFYTISSQRAKKFLKMKFRN